MENKDIIYKWIKEHVAIFAVIGGALILVVAGVVIGVNRHINTSKNEISGEGMVVNETVTQMTECDNNSLEIERTSTSDNGEIETVWKSSNNNDCEIVLEETTDIISQSTTEENSKETGKDSIESTFKAKGGEYEIINGGASIISIGEGVTELEIPSSIDGYPVTEIGYIIGGENIRNVIIPSTVKKMQLGAFGLDGFWDAYPSPGYESNYSKIPHLDIIIDGGEGQIEICQDNTNYTFGYDLLYLINQRGEGRTNVTVTYLKSPTLIQSTAEKRLKSSGGRYHIENGNAIITALENTSYVEVPNTIDGCPVTEIDICKNLEISKILIPNSVKKIAKNAFGEYYNWSNLNEIPHLDIVVDGSPNQIGLYNKFFNKEYGNEIEKLFNDSRNGRTNVTVTYLK